MGVLDTLPSYNESGNDISAKAPLKTINALCCIEWLEQELTV